MSVAVASIPHRPLLDLPFSELERELASAGLKPFHARALWRAMHFESARDLSEREEFAIPLKQWIAARGDSGASLEKELPDPVADIASSDGLTRKFLLRLADGQTVETVLMGFTGRH